METKKFNPADYENESNLAAPAAPAPAPKAASRGVNKGAVLGAVGVGGAAAVGATAAAMNGDGLDDVDTENSDVFDTASAQTYHAEEAARVAKEEATEEPAAKEEHIEETPEHIEIEGEDEIIDEIDVVAAADEISGENNMEGNMDIHMDSYVAFTNVDTVFDEEGNEYLQAEIETSDGNHMAVVDINGDGNFDVMHDGEGNFSEMPVEMNVADIQMQESNYDDYIAHNENFDMDIETGDTTIDDDMNLV